MNDEPGWVRIVLDHEQEGNGRVALHYCPEHAQRLDLDDPDVFPVE